jgi:predicted protein tyrosine phosphatase
VTADGHVKLLFVCTYNQSRSATAAVVFSGYDRCNVASAGLHKTAVSVLTPRLVEWADVIFVMEPAQRWKLRLKFGKLVRGKQVVCLNIPDQYQYMEPELVDVLERKVCPVIESVTGEAVREPADRLIQNTAAWAIA